MKDFLVRRLLSTIPTLLLISFVSFLVISLPPGDYLTTFQQTLVSQAGMSPSEAERLADEMRHRYGLDRPFLVQYVRWLGGILTRGDLGFSFTYRRPVAEVIFPRLGMTLLIALSSHVISVAVGVLIGIFSATHRHRLSDHFFALVAFLGLSTPNFFLALLAAYVLTFRLGIHVGGLFSPEMTFAPWSVAKLIDFLSHVWVPIVIVGLAGTARNMRVMRANLLDVLNQPFVHAARAKGLTETVVVLKHALRNAVQPIIMYLGMAMPFLIAGELVTGIVLNLPTTGPVFLNAIVSQDMYLAGSFLMMLSIVLVVGNLLADVALVWVDPRVRYG